MMDLTTIGKWTTDLTGYLRLSLFVLLGWGALGCGQVLHSFAGASSAGKINFERYEIVTGSAKQQTVLPGSFLDGAMAELAVVSTDEDGNHRLCIYALGEGILIGDLNGDGRAELLAGQNPNELRVFAGVPGPVLFTRKPQTVIVELPKDERNAWLADLNRDGKQDLLIHHPSNTAAHRVTTLITE